MNRLIYSLIALWLAGALAGCATMSKNDCENANWNTIGYNDGAQGIQANKLNTYNKSCAKYKIVPDTNAYQTGWQKGIRAYCTSATGFNTGAAGMPYRPICPPDVAAGYMSGWQQGVRQYCAPANGLQQGLQGNPYRGVCPPDMEIGFQQRYQLGNDLRQANIAHQNAEDSLSQIRQELATEKDSRRRHDLMHDLFRLRSMDDDSEAKVSELSACTSNDWFQTGIADGETGQLSRESEIAAICRGYGSIPDVAGYRQGWEQGNSNYCTYASGLYAGQANQEYHGVCHGYAYMVFWSGYTEGLNEFRADRYEDHPRPRFAHPQSHEQARPHKKAKRHKRVKHPKQTKRNKSEEGK